MSGCYVTWSYSSIAEQALAIATSAYLNRAYDAGGGNQDSDSHGVVQAWVGRTRGRLGSGVIIARRCCSRRTAYALLFLRLRTLSKRWVKSGGSEFTKSGAPKWWTKRGAPGRARNGKPVAQHVSRASTAKVCCVGWPTMDSFIKSRGPARGGNPSLLKG